MNPTAFRSRSAVRHHRRWGEYAFDQSSAGRREGAVRYVLAPARIKPFTLYYEKGRTLYRATIDLAIVPDDNMSVELDGQNVEVIRLVASAMPRMETRE